MKKSITQEMPYGCGVACFAFVADLTYKEIEKFLGEEQSISNRFVIKHFREELNRFGLNYTSHHVQTSQKIDPVEGMIVLLRRSSQFPTGHYLAFHEGKWMDPYINLNDERAFNDPSSGFRDNLPGLPMYVLIPE